MFWHPSLLCSLILRGNPKIIDNIMRLLASHQHPTLKTLQVHGYSNIGSTPSTTQPLLDVALRDSIPQLLHLSLDLTFDWALVRGLRSLRVSYTRNKPLPFTLLDVIDTLARCPQLEDLEVRLPSTFRRAVDVTRAPISLPYLDLAVIVAALGVCNQILEMIPRFSSSTRLLVSALDLAHDIPALLVTSSFVGGHAWSDGAPVVRSLVVTGAPTNESPPAPDDARRLGFVGQTTPSRLTSISPKVSWSYDQMHITTNHIGAQVVVRTSAAGLQFLQSALHTWPLSGVTHLDLRSLTSIRDLLPVLLAAVLAVTTVVLRPEASIARDLVETLRSQLREHGKRVLAHIAFDAERVVNVQSQGDNGWQGALVPPSAVLARHTIMSTMQYCKEAASADVAVDTVEIYNEPVDARHRLIGPEGSVDWTELHGNLRHGFVYEGVMHSGEPQYDGKLWDSFAVS